MSGFVEDSLVYQPYMEVYVSTNVKFIEVSAYSKKYTSTAHSIPVSMTEAQKRYRTEIYEHCEREMYDFLCHLPEEMGDEIREYWREEREHLLNGMM